MNDTLPDPKVLLKETYNYIVEHPEQHNQRHWQLWKTSSNCGTAYCFAGMAVHLAGYDINVHDCVKEWQDSPHVSDVARELLGLDPEQAGMLFRGENSIDRIRQLLEEWNVL
jgi:hypothetical protein